MIVPSSGLANTLFSLNFNTIITSNIHNKDNMDMEIDTQEIDLYYPVLTV